MFHTYSKQDHTFLMVYSALKKVNQLIIYSAFLQLLQLARVFGHYTSQKGGSRQIYYLPTPTLSLL